ncbi:MAG: metallophosphoesterase family protein [Terriglobales bacterium]
MNVALPRSPGLRARILPRALPWLLLLLLLQGGAKAGAQLPPAKQARPAAAHQDVRIDLGGGKRSFSFIVYGDIRFTDPSDTWDTDPARRVALVNRIAQERPDLLLITGDLVLNGERFSDWEVFDQETQPWHDARIPVFPVLGNHDLVGSEELALQNYFRRFPALNGHRWYSLRYGNCYFLMVDSASGTGPESAQGKWLASELDHLPPGTDYVFVVMHHPLYTQSTDENDAGHASRSSERRLAMFLEGRQKTLAARIFALSGHVHNYERYQNGGVMYIVTAGGGAVPYAVTRRPSDFYREAGPTYHFCRFTLSGQRLNFEMIKMVGEGRDARWMVKDSFEMK